MRTLEEDLATGDGHYDKCVLCGNRHKGGKLCKCDFCPDVYHYGCIRGVRPKPKESSWPLGWAPGLFCDVMRHPGQLLNVDKLPAKYLRLIAGDNDGGCHTDR